MTAALCAVVLAAFPAGSSSGATPPAGGGRVAIFYYPWYSTPSRDGTWAHWYVERDGQSQLAVRHYPSRGLYSSSNAKVLAAQMREIAAAGVDTVVVSWWGEGSPEAARLPLVATAARRVGLSVAVHHEPYQGRTPASTAADIVRLRDAGYRDFYVYDADRDPPGAWAEALAGVDGVRVFGHTTLAGRAKASGFDGVYTYDIRTWTGRVFRRLCAQAHAMGLLCAPSVGPGYDAELATGDSVVSPRLNGTRYERMWKSALRSGADLVTITSYNEWLEGTQIEPARPQVGRPGYDGAWGRRGIDAQRAYLDATATWAARFTRG